MGALSSVKGVELGMERRLGYPLSYLLMNTSLIDVEGLSSERCDLNVLLRWGLWF